MTQLERRISELEARQPRSVLAPIRTDLTPEEAYRLMCDGDAAALHRAPGVDAMSTYLAMLDGTPRNQRRNRHANV